MRLASVVGTGLGRWSADLDRGRGADRILDIGGGALVGPVVRPWAVGGSLRVSGGLCVINGLRVSSSPSVSGMRVRGGLRVRGLCGALGTAASAPAAAARCL